MIHQKVAPPTEGHGSPVLSFITLEQFNAIRLVQVCLQNSMTRASKISISSSIYLVFKQVTHTNNTKTYITMIHKSNCSPYIFFGNFFCLKKIL